MDQALRASCLVPPGFVVDVVVGDDAAMCITINHAKPMARVFITGSMTDRALPPLERLSSKALNSVCARRPAKKATQPSPVSAHLSTGELTQQVAMHGHVTHRRMSPAPPVRTT